MDTGKVLLLDLGDQAAPIDHMIAEVRITFLSPAIHLLALD